MSMDKKGAFLMKIQKVREQREVSTISKPHVPASNHEELLSRVYAEVLFIQGLSYGLSEDGGKQLRRRIENIYRDVREYLKTLEVVQDEDRPS